MPCPTSLSRTWSKCVSLLLRYGMWGARCCSAATTSPSTLSDRLMYCAGSRGCESAWGVGDHDHVAASDRLILRTCASRLRSPSAPDRATRSLPARSTM